MSTLRRIGVTAANVSLALGGLLVPSTASASAAPRAVTATPAPAAGTTSPLGTSINSLDDVGRVTKLLGRPLTSVRVFLSSTPSSWSKNQLLATIPANGTVSLSFDSVNPGTPDQIQAFLSGKPNTMTCYATYFHEPEDNFTTAAQKSDYTKAWDSYAPAFRKAGCIPTLILMKWSLNPHSGRDWHDWYPRADVDALAFDAYNTRAKQGTYGIPANYLAPVLAASRETGLPWALTELGSDIPAGTAPADRAAWAHGVAVAASADPKFLFADWWDVLSDSGRDYTLDNATALSWNNGPATSPSAPSAISVTAGLNSVAVAWKPPADGGSAITGYTVSAVNTATAAVTTAPAGAAATSATVTGLNDGQDYLLSVTATNAVGTSRASATQLVTPGTSVTVAGAPTIGTATPADTAASVSFTAPADNGGSSVTSYRITAVNTSTGMSAAAPATVGAAATSGTVTGLTNGHSYALRVVAINAIGDSAASALSDPVTPASASGAPTIGLASAGNASASVTWTPPASNGGSPITGYTVTAVTSTGGSVMTATAAAAATAGTVTGLTNGKTYKLSVRATTAIGASPSSATSNLVTPATLPGVPAIGSATGGVLADTVVSATAWWKPPTSNGGASVTGYKVTAEQYNGSTLVLSTTSQLLPATARSLQFPGLVKAAKYRFRVSATNSIGSGGYSTPSNPVSAY